MITGPHLRRAFAFSLVVPFLAACADVEEQPWEEEELPPPTVEEAPETEPLDAEPGSIQLEPVMDDPQVSGEATILEEGGVVMVAIDVQGLPDAGEYPAHIHLGTCAEGGPVGVPLDPVMGLADGTGSSMTTLEEGELPGEDWFIQVHGQDGSPISCGDHDAEPAA